MSKTLVLLLGSAVFVAITFFEQLPVVGWLGVFVSFAAWLALTRLMSERRGPLGAAWAGAMGGLTGLVGAFTSWAAQTGNLFGLSTPPGDRFGAGFGFVGATIGLVYWPLVGAAFCFALGLLFGGRGQATRRRFPET